MQGHFKGYVLIIFIQRESLKQCLQFVEECRAVLSRIQDTSVHTPGLY